jgi:hypothetical protein
MARHFTALLDKVARGETIRSSEGRMFGRMIPDRGFMPGPQAAALFREHRADLRTANAVTLRLFRGSNAPTVSPSPMWCAVNSSSAPTPWPMTLRGKEAFSFIRTESPARLRDRHSYLVIVIE